VAALSLGLMSLPSKSGSLRVIAFLALLLFAGDVMADSVGELCQTPCPAEMSESGSCPDKAPCHCACAGHVGAVIVTDFAMPLESDTHPTSFLSSDDEGRPPRLVVSIDHPPQLS
jgi:hypothetical protein